MTTSKKATKWTVEKVDCDGLPYTIEPLFFGKLTLGTERKTKNTCEICGKNLPYVAGRKSMRCHDCNGKWLGDNYGKGRQNDGKQKIKNV